MTLSQLTNRIISKCTWPRFKVIHLNFPNISKITSLDIYPNPATTALTITSSTTISQVIISNLLGQAVYTLQPNTENITVNISPLPPGLYFVKVNNIEVRKFVKE